MLSSGKRANMYSDWRNATAAGTFIGSAGCTIACTKGSTIKIIYTGMRRANGLGTYQRKQVHAVHIQVVRTSMLIGKAGSPCTPRTVS